MTGGKYESHVHTNQQHQLSYWLVHQCTLINYHFAINTLGIFGVSFSVASWQLLEKFLPNWWIENAKFFVSNLGPFSWYGINRDFFWRLYSYAAIFPLPNGI